MSHYGGGGGGVTVCRRPCSSSSAVVIAMAAEAGTDGDRAATARTTLIEGAGRWCGGDRGGGDRYGGGGGSRRRRRRLRGGGPPRGDRWRRRRRRLRRPRRYSSSRDAGRNWRDRELGGARGGATHLARIHGTEEDKVNCPFYFKIGACRHGDRCSRHTTSWPDGDRAQASPSSQTVWKSCSVGCMYQTRPWWRRVVTNRHRHAIERAVDGVEDDATIRTPVKGRSQIAAAGGDPSQLDPKKVLRRGGLRRARRLRRDRGAQRLREPRRPHGRQRLLQVRRRGTPTRRSRRSSAASTGRPLVCEFSPVTDFREARCRQPIDRVVVRARWRLLQLHAHPDAVALVEKGPRSATRRSGARRARSASASAGCRACRRATTPQNCRLAVARRSRDKGKG